MKTNNISRRKFFGQASCGAIGATTFLSTLLNLKTVNAAASFNSSPANKFDDYKALVCILNTGGMDTFNMLVPRSAPEYAQYALSRSNMALDLNTLRPINPLNPDGKQYGVHPLMPGMQNLFENGQMSFIANIGSLVQPITKTQFYNGSIQTPLGLFSHADQIMHWQTGVPNKRSGTGWGGMIADLLNDANSNQNVSMNISLSGNNIFQSGENTVEYSIHPVNGSTGIIDHNVNNWVFNTAKTNAINGMVNPVDQDIFKNTYRKTIKNAIEGHELLSPVLETDILFNVPFAPP